MIRHRLTTLTALAAILAGTTSYAAPRLPREQDPIAQHMDTTASPRVDFFQYANGRWLKENPIPSNERGWGIGNLVRDEVYGQLRGICESAAATRAAKRTSEQRVGDFWATGMDSAAAERLGADPMAPYLAEIAADTTRPAILATIARFQALGFAPLYSTYIFQDERNSEKYAVHLYQGGIRLPDRDYYFTDDSTTTHVRAEYVKHLAAMFRLLGESEPVSGHSADAVMRMETALAAHSRTLEALRDPWANYNKRSLAGLDSLTPAISWRAQFAGMELASIDTVIVGQPEFLAVADSMVTATPLDDLRTYLRWNVASSLAQRLSSPFDLEHFHFYGTVLAGVEVPRPRWKRVLDAEEDGIGELMGQVWVKQYCSPRTKARYEKLTADVIEVYRKRIRALTWMSTATKQKALAKLDKVGRKVAYPDHWRDYSSLDVDRASYAENQVKVNQWWFRYQAAKLGKPVDRTEWDMTPQTYNAYYDGSKVEIVLPAAAFVIPGLPDSLVDDAVLYSYAGASTIGHEITHGFDDEGRQFDMNGNLNPWWAPEDSTRFAERAHRLAEQFDAYTVGEKHVRGQATLGENIADLGGVVLGYEAFKETEQYRKRQIVNGLTPDQRFFLGYALAWMVRRRPESVADMIMSDVHAPEFLRVNGPLANVPEFYAAFGVKPGDPMWRPDSVRVSIW